MFDYQSQLELSNRLAFYKANHQQKWIIPRNDKWGEALFYASVLHQSSYADATIIDKNQLEDLAQAYDKQFNVRIDINSLIDDDLIRIVFGKVNFPVITNRAIDTFNRLEAFIECELPFFLGLSDEQIVATKTIDDLIHLVGGPESQVGLTLNQTQNIFWKEVDGRVEIPLDETFQKIFDDKNRLRFLSWLIEQRKDHLLRISLEDFEKLRNLHVSQFALTPGLDEMISQRIIGEDETTYKLLFFDHGINEEIQNKSVAILWEKLCADESFLNDYERLQYWYYRSIYHNSSINIGHYFLPDLLERFLNTAHKAILKDSDLTTGNQEYFRLVSDNSNLCQLCMIWERPRPLTELEFDKMSLFQIQQHFRFSFYGEGDNILLSTRSRFALAYFIRQLVINDPIRDLNRLTELFEHSANKPYILWQACMAIRYSKPELIPYLVNNPHTASLSYMLIFETDLSDILDRQRINVRIDLIQDHSKLLFKYLSTSPILANDIIAKILFECLLYTTHKKFRINRQDNEDYVFLANDFREIFSQTAMPGDHYYGSKKITPEFIAEIMDELITELESYSPVDTLKNRLLSLPFVQLDLAAWLMEVIPKINFFNFPHDGEEFLLRVTNYFSRTYLKAINTMKINAIDYFGDKTIKFALPSWAEYRQNDLQINWGMACLNLSEQGLLNEFLYPSLNFRSSEDTYDDQNKFVAHKLRSHLFILINAFNGLFVIQKKLTSSGRRIEEVLVFLEIRIRDIILRNSTNNPVKGNIDIFDESFERWYLGNDNNELIPITASIINRFSPKSREEIINALTKSDQFVRSLKMLDRIVSENERLRLLKMITGRADFDDILGKLSFQDLQFVTSNLSQDGLFISEAENALALIENKSTSHNYTKNEVFIFRIRLLIAYHKKDLSEIDSILVPPATYYNGQKFQPEMEKDFYRALILMKTNHGEESYNLYDELVSKESGNPVIALNRFAAKLQWVHETENLDLKKQLCTDALDEWMRYNNTNSDRKKWPDIEDSITFNLLEAYKILEEHDEFDNLYANTVIESRMRPEFLDIRIDNLLERNLQNAAELLLAESKTFHKLSDGDFPDFIKNLEDRMNTGDIIEFLTTQYDRIYRLSPKDLIKLVPESVNGGKDIPEFLFNELIGASIDMLAFVNSLPDVDHEDKYSDLLMLSLNGRLRNYKWHVSNLRRGFSNKKQNNEILAEQQNESENFNLGLVDFGICNGPEVLGICEAFITYGKNTLETQKHNLKIFNYDPARRLYYLIIYFKGGTTKFNKAWEDYKNIIEEFIDFPHGYELKEKLVPQTNQSEHDGIRSGISLHNDNTKLYHIFINVDYRLELNKKSVRGDGAKEISALKS